MADIPLTSCDLMVFNKNKQFMSLDRVCCIRLSNLIVKKKLLFLWPIISPSVLYTDIALMCLIFTYLHDTHTQTHTIIMWDCDIAALCFTNIANSHHFMEYGCDREKNIWNTFITLGSKLINYSRKVESHE